MSTQTHPHHVAMLASPGLGHLIPLAELAKLVSSRHGFSVTLFIPTIAGQSLQAATNVLKNLNSSHINHVFLPPVNFDDLPPGVQDEVRIVLSVVRSLEPLKAELSALASRAELVAFVSDMFGLEAFELTRGELGIPSYMYFLTSAMTVEFMFYFPTLHEEVTCEFRDMPEPVRLPGCVPLHGRDFIDPIQDRSSQAYQFVLRNSKMVSMADGILLNSFKELEPEAIEDLLKGGPGRPPVYPIGPVIQSGSGGGEPDKEPVECLEWLDQHPSGSVLFVSFGSGGTLSMEQIHELAHGLEMSGERFMWVVRSPEKSASGSFFSGQTKENPLGFLPDGFLDRTQDRGLVIPSWAPQIEVLSHPSTRGFLTHCGWNSALESLTHGVPLIAWPLYAEQRQNAVLLTEGVKVAMRVKAGENGLVDREEISKVIKSLMTGDEGETLRLKAKELEGAAKAALGENGSSSEMLAQLALKWKSN